MTPTMILSALLCLSIAVSIIGGGFLFKALMNTRDKLATAEARLNGARRATMAYSDHLSNLKVLQLPKLVVRPATDTDQLPGWVELDVGDHGEAVHVCLRFEEGMATPYGAKVLAILRLFAVEMAVES